MVAERAKISIEKTLYEATAAKDEVIIYANSTEAKLGVLSIKKKSTT